MTKFKWSHWLPAIFIVIALFGFGNALPGIAGPLRVDGPSGNVRNPRPYFDQNTVVEEARRPQHKVILGHRTGGQGGVMYYDACAYLPWMAADDFNLQEGTWTSPSKDEFGDVPLWVWSGPKKTNVFVLYGLVDAGSYRYTMGQTIPETDRLSVRCISKWANPSEGNPPYAPIPVNLAPSAPGATVTPIPGASPTPIPIRTPFPTPVPSCPTFAGDPTRDLDIPAQGNTCGWSISAGDRAQGSGKTGDVPVGFLADYHDPGTGQTHLGVRWDDAQGRGKAIYADQATFKRLR